VRQLLVAQWFRGAIKLEKRTGDNAKQVAPRSFVLPLGSQIGQLWWLREGSESIANGPCDSFEDQKCRRVVEVVRT
jgi:hypothetical protein